MKSELPSTLILYNTPRPAADGDHPGPESEAGVLAEVQAVSAAMAKRGIRHRAAGAATLQDVPAVLAGSAEPVVFNLVEGFHRHSQDAMLVPSLCRAFGKECTGSPTSCLLGTLDKWQTKTVLLAGGLPVPAGVVVPVGGKPRRGELPPAPWIVKPTHSDASEGIDGAASIFHKFSPALLRAVAKIHQRFGQPALIEQFIDGREFNVSVLQVGRNVEVLPIAEIDFSAFGADRPRVEDYAAKWLADSFEYRNTPRVSPAKLSKRLEGRIRTLALAAWEALGCRDYARVDFRVNQDDEPMILEVNPNPDIAPDVGFAAALACAGKPFEDFVAAMIANAAARIEGPAAAARRAKPQAAKAHEVTIRRTAAGDRDHIVRFVEATGFFRPNEVTIAAEVLDDAIAAGPEGDYQSYTAEVNGEPAGWVCFGATPCTVGTHDLYWIAVAPHCQDKGIGKLLMRHAEKLIADRGGLLVVVETSGHPRYEATRKFYLRLGYEESARVTGFYAPLDDKIVYTKAPAVNGD
jgi:D-alanine-D-alanine ligase